MMRFIYRSLRKIYNLAVDEIDFLVTLIRLKGNEVKYGHDFKSNGRPVFDIWKGGTMQVGNNVQLNNGKRYNVIGRQQACYFVVRTGAVLTIGNNTGISATAIVCAMEITIGNNVKIGGNTVIYDTDFHSLDPVQRLDISTDMNYTRHAPVVIGDNVFIGAHSTILKGISIGNNSIIGAGSVVTKNIPADQIWAGNPVKFIKSLS